MIQGNYSYIPRASAVWVDRRVLGAPQRRPAPGHLAMLGPLTTRPGGLQRPGPAPASAPPQPRPTRELGLASLGAGRGRGAQRAAAAVVMAPGRWWAGGHMAPAAQWAVRQ